MKNQGEKGDISKLYNNPINGEVGPANEEATPPKSSLSATLLSNKTVEESDGDSNRKVKAPSKVKISVDGETFNYIFGESPEKHGRVYVDSAIDGGKSKYQDLEVIRVRVRDFSEGFNEKGEPKGEERFLSEDYVVITPDGSVVVQPREEFLKLQNQSKTIDFDQMKYPTGEEIINYTINPYPKS